MSFRNHLCVLLWASAYLMLGTRASAAEIKSGRVVCVSTGMIIVDTTSDEHTAAAETRCSDLSIDTLGKQYLALAVIPCTSPGGAGAPACSDLNTYSLDQLYRKRIWFSYKQQDDGLPVLTQLVGLLTPDERGTFEASAHIGVGIDSFAASELKTYLNPEVSGEIRERGVAGFDFGYRLLSGRLGQLWVYGRTVHGVRSTEVDCQKTPDAPVCDSFDAANPGKGTIFIIRNATSLEGFAGFRYEITALGRWSESPARIYFKAQAGFLTIAGNGKDVVDLHHIGVGAISSKGRFRGSFLELGYGRNDLFLDNAKHRYKIDGYLIWSPPHLMKTLGLSPYAEMKVDADLSNGSDSVQSYLGFQFDLDALFGRDIPALKGAFAR